MKTLNGIISVLLGLTSMYIMFVWATNDIQLGLGFMALLTSIIFLCFVLLEESKEEVERLRQIILNSRK